MAIDYSKQFSPRRGSATTMATTKKDIVLAVGELFIEYPDTGVGTGAVKVKIGDGTTDYENLPYAITNDASASVVNFTADTSETVAEALAEVVTGTDLQTIVPALKQAITLLDAETVKSIVLDEVSGTFDDNEITLTSPDYTIGATTVSGGAQIALTPEANRGKTASTFNVVSTDSTISVGVTSGNLDIEANPTGAVSNLYKNNLVANRAVISDANGKVYISDTTATEIGYVHGTTQSIQYQLNGKQPTITGAATTITSADLATGRTVITDANGKIGISSVTTTELAYLSGTTSSVQTQINGKANSVHTHTEDDITGGISVTALKLGAEGEKISTSLLPAAALGEFVVVVDETARLALTISDVQNGDVVKQNDTGVLYFVKDETKLAPYADPEEAFEEFRAGTAASVDWSDVQNKPASVTAAFVGATSAENGAMGLVPAPAAGDEAKYLAGNSTWVSLPSAFGGATTAAGGSLGFVPAPTTADTESYLCGDGTWVDIAVATTAHKGFMSTQDKTDHDDMVSYLASTDAFDFGDEG